jgi:hypothetical protein
MPLTHQEEALKTVRTIFGRTAYTEDHVGYRMVGVKREGKYISGIGDTWREAITALETKLGKDA